MAVADTMSPFYALNVESQERKLANKHDSKLHGFGPRRVLDTAMNRGLGVGVRDMDASKDSSSSKGGKGGKGKPKLSSNKAGKGGKGGTFEYNSLSSSGSSKSGSSGSSKSGSGGSSNSGSSGSSKSGQGRSSKGSKKSKKSGKGGALQNLNFVMVSCVPLSSNILLLLVDIMPNSS
jgi:hypothetical protein